MFTWAAYPPGAQPSQCMWHPRGTPSIHRAGSLAEAKNSSFFSPRGSQSDAVQIMSLVDVCFMVWLGTILSLNVAARQSLCCLRCLDAIGKLQFMCRLLLGCFVTLAGCPEKAIWTVLFMCSPSCKLMLKHDMQQGHHIGTRPGSASWGCSGTGFPSAVFVGTPAGSPRR